MKDHLTLIPPSTSHYYSLGGAIPTSSSSSSSSTSRTEFSPLAASLLVASSKPAASSTAMKKKNHQFGGDGSTSGKGWDIDIDMGIDMENMDMNMDVDMSRNMGAECRICQEEDETTNLETPCSCSGSLKLSNLSVHRKITNCCNPTAEFENGIVKFELPICPKFLLKFAHRKCVQRWCNEKGDTTCEICRQLSLIDEEESCFEKPFKSGYTAPIQSINHNQDVPTDFRGNWGITMGPRQLDLHDPRIFALAAERHLLGAGDDFDEYAAGNISVATCFRFAALILMALLLLRHAFSFSTEQQDPTTTFTLFLLRAAGFLLPCYIMARVMNTLQQRRQRQEAEAMAAAEVTMFLPGMRLTVPSTRMVMP